MACRQRMVLPAIAATCITFAPRGARAEGDGDIVDVGVGLIGALGGNFLDKPDRQSYEPDIYPGFTGGTFGGGFLADLRLVDLVGVEVDVIRSSDHGSGTVTLNGIDFDVTVGQGAWHVPILAKLTLGTPLVAPTFFVGPELVFVSDAEAEVDGPSAIPVPPDIVTAQADDYVMITFGGGVEINLPLPVIDLRIPLTLRGSFNPSVSGEFEDRVDQTPTGWSYDSEWKYVVLFTAGAAIYF